MNTYFNFLHEDLLRLIVYKLDFHQFKIFTSLIAVGINYSHLVNLKFSDHITEIMKEFSTIGQKEYELIFCCLILEKKLKLNVSLKRLRKTENDFLI